MSSSSIVEQANHGAHASQPNPTLIPGPIITLSNDTTIDQASGNSVSKLDVDGRLRIDDTTNIGPTMNDSQRNVDNWLEMDNFVDFFSICCSAAMIFGGLIPYIPQYLKIKNSLNNDGFSTYVCLTLLVANILRIMFWFGHRFELPILIQSFVMIAGMLALMEICIRVREKSPYMISTIGFGPGSHRHRSLIGFSARNFWDWDDYFSYIKFLALFTLTLSIITYSLLDSYMYVETIGFVAVFIESMLGVPQLLRNYAKKSTRGMSVEMVVLWLSGDLFKTLYFILKKAPAQFIVCGFIQVTVDILILIQVFLYKRPNVTYRKLPKST